MKITAGSRVKGQGSRVKGQGSRVKGQGSSTEYGALVRRLIRIGNRAGKAREMAAIMLGLSDGDVMVIRVKKEDTK